MPRKSQRESAAELDAAPGGAAAVDRALSLLSAFRVGDDALTLAELSTRTGLYKSTALRLLSSLEHRCHIQRLADGRYALGGEIARLNAIYTASFSLDRVVMPVLQKLSEKTGESAAYHVKRGDSRLCLYRVDSPHPVRDHIRMGELFPMNRGTGGRVLTAFDPELCKRASSADRRLYAEIRERGFHTAMGDRLAEVAGISAPVFHADGTLAASLTLTMPTHRYDAKYAKWVLVCARELTGLV